MDRTPFPRAGAPLSVLVLSALFLAPVLHAQGGFNTGEPQVVSTGQRITPLAPQGARFEPLNPNLADNPTYTVGQAVSTVVSPDGKTLLILTSGYNLWNYTSGAQIGSTNPLDSTEWVFVFDISTPTPIQKQALPLPATYSGMAFNPQGTEFYVSGGNSDNVHIFSKSAAGWAETAAPVALGHLAKASAAALSAGGLGLETQPEAAGLAVSPDGHAIAVLNYENDSVSLLLKSPGGWALDGEQDLRPGKIDSAQKGVPGGEFPYWIVAKGATSAYVSSIRDREVLFGTFGGNSVTRIKVPGQPNRMVLNKAQTLLFVAMDNSDSVAVIDTNTNTVVDEIKVTAPVAVYANKHHYKGANPNSLALSPDEKTLYVTNGGENAVAVISLSTPGNSQVVGLIPTGFYPNSVSVSADGKLLYIANGKSATGPNPGYCVQLAAATVPCSAANQYTWQLTKAGFQTVPVPTSGELGALTAKVLENNHFDRTLTPDQKATMAFLHQHIKHVIYIIKENRTYDQVLGDLEVGNGDPSLTQFPEADTPNFHAIARNFVDFDNFFDVSDVSGDGWPWSTSARTTDVIEKEIPVNYAGRGVNNDSEGTNRNLDVAYADTRERQVENPLISKDPDLLPGRGNVAAPDGDDENEKGEGYIWNAALRAGLTVRDYGFFIDITRYNLAGPLAPYTIPESINPFADKVQVAFSTNPTLRKYTDKYFRGFDNSFPDYYRFTEWQREFNGYVASGKLPNLSLVRIMHDHFGNFKTALNGVNTPELQMADNDYAVGQVVDAVAHSPFKDNTLVFVIEDDAQDGGDHMDAHRSTAFVVGPYVKQGFVDSSRYNTVSMLRTMEDILGTAHLNLNDASALPMANAFDTKQAAWDYSAVPSALLTQTTLPISPLKFNTSSVKFNTSSASLRPTSLHNAAWWAAETRGMDFSIEDHLDSGKFNRVVWKGTMGDTPYPTDRTGLDLRIDRAELLKAWRDSQGRRQVQAAEELGAPAVSQGPGN